MSKSKITMELYHITRTEYSVGKIIKIEPNSTTRYYKNAVINNQNWIDDFLDVKKPNNYPERKNTLYAFNSLGNCGAFKNGEQYKFYKIEMVNPIASPMCLTDALLKDNEELNSKIAEEYWNPTMNWKYLEYMCSEMEIKEILNPPNFIEIALGKQNYLEDKTLTKKIFK